MSQLTWKNESTRLAFCAGCKTAFLTGKSDLMQVAHVCRTKHDPSPRSRVIARTIAQQRFCGPGCQLLKILRVFHKKDCGCGARASVMDQRGTDWCEQNTTTILEWLKEGAEKRGIPFVEWLAKRFVARAIKKARKAEAAFKASASGS